MLFHLATPPGEGGIAVFELYGDGVEIPLAKLFRSAFAASGLPSTGAARLGRLIDDVSGEEIDEVLLSNEPADATWSRLACWTVSIHGGPWLQSRVATCLEAAGFERAKRREILERSVELGALDAFRASAFERLVEAPTERAAAFFLRQYEGELSRAVDEIREHVRAGSPSRARRRIDELLGASRVARRLAEPLRLLLAGKPNAGKSTLFNRFVERERVLVSPTAGTTRDFLRERIAIDGFPVELIDSAGLRASASDPVEEEAIRRVERESVDVALYLLAPPWDIDDEDRTFLEGLDAELVLRVANFRDEAPHGHVPEGIDHAISALHGDGIDQLRRLIVERVMGPGLEDTTGPFSSTQVGTFEALRRLLDGALVEISRATLDEFERLSIIGLRSAW